MSKKNAKKLAISFAHGAKRKYFQVNRKELAGNVKKSANINGDAIYYSRNYGLFLVCFPDTVGADGRSMARFAVTKRRFCSCRLTLAASQNSARRV